LLRAVTAAQRAVELITGELNINSKNGKTTQKSHLDYQAEKNIMRSRNHKNDGWDSKDLRRYEVNKTLSDLYKINYQNKFCI
jgi:hypothetical protein